MTYVKCKELVDHRYSFFYFFVFIFLSFPQMPEHVRVYISDAENQSKKNT